MVLPGELRTTEDGELQAENPYTSILQGKLDIAALLEDHLHLLPEGLDPEADPTVLEQFFGTARPQSEAGFSAHLRPCRDPSKDHLLSTLHAMEAFYPGPFAAFLDGLLMLSGLLLVGCMALSAAAVWALWNYIDRGLAIAAIVLLLLHLPATSLLLAMQLGGHHYFTAWFMVLVYDLAYLIALPPLQRQRLAQRRRLARRFSGLPGMELWLWQYRSCRQLMVSALLAVPMALLGILGSVRGWAAAAPAPAPALGVVVAASVVSAFQAAVGFGEASLNARWAGQMSFLSYTVMALQLRGSKKLPYEWQTHLAERRLVVKPDAPDFCELSRPQQCQLLRLALQRPHFAISNVVTHPRPPQKNSRLASAGQPPPPAASRGPGTGNLAAASAENCGGAVALKGAAAAVAAGCSSCNAGLAAAGRRLGALLGPVFSRITGTRAACCGCSSGRRLESGSDADSDSSTRPQAPLSACLLLQSKSAVKSVVGALAGPLAAARSTLAVSEFSVNLVSFTDAAACKHCRTLLELVIRQGLRSLELCDSKLQLDFFGVLTSYLPSRHCVLNKLVLKDVMSSGISTLCMLCDGLARNSSVTHLDLSNNQLWGLRGAKELRLMLTGNGGLRVLLLPFCNITSVGAVEILRGAAECATLEQIDFSQNHIGDDVPDWSEVELRNMAMREIDLSFNWIQDSLMGWTAALLEAFPTLKRLHLNHNSDAAASRVASRAATPRMMTPRTLTPRTLTPSNLRIASYSNPPAAIFSIPSGSPAPAIAVPITSPSSVRETGQTFAVGSCSPQMLQPMQSTTVLSPCGSERLEQLCSSPTQTPMQAPPVRQATGTSAGPNAYNSAMTTITNNSSNCNNLDWQAHTHAPAAEGPGRSRGQHLIVHLEHYVLQLPAPIAATAAGGGCSSRDMNCRSLGRDSSLAAVPTVHSGYSAASPTLAFHGPLVPGASLCAVPGASGASVGLSPGGGGGAGTTTRPTGSLWSAVAAMERLDLRGVPLPSWWARNPALRPASVLIDESMVYEEPPPAPAPVTSPGFASGGPSGGGGTSGGGGLELPHHVVRSLEAGLAQGLVVIDLNSPEYKSISRCQQLVAIYTALQCATHITISNTTRIGGAASGIPPVSGLHSVTSQQLQQQPLSGGGGMTLVRSATSSFPRTNSGTAAFSMYAGQVSGGGGCRLQSDTGYAAGCGGGSGGAMPLRPTSTLRSSSLAAVRGTVSAVNGGVGGSGNNGSMHMCRASSLRGSGGTLATALVTSPPLGSLGSGDLGGGAGSASVAGRVSITRRGGEGTVSSLHRFALERGGSSFTAPTASGGGGSKGNATDGGAAVAVASAAGMCEPSVLPSATLGRVSVNLYQNATAFPTVRTHTGQTIQYHNSHRLNSFRKQLNLRNGIHIPTASVNANQLLQSVLPYYPSPQAAALPGIDAARSVQPAAVLSGPWGSGPNTPGGTGGTCLAGAFGSGIEGDGAASAPLVISQTNMLWSGQVVDHSSAHSTGSQLEHSKLQQHQRHQEYQELQQQQQGAPYVVRSRTIGTCLAVVVEAAGGGSGGGAPCSAPCGLGGGGGLGGGDSSSRDPLAATTAATPTAAELFYPKGAANDLAEAIDVQSRQSLDQTAAQGSASIGSTATRAAVEEAVCLQAVGLHRLLEDRTTDKGTEGSGAAIAKELLSAGTSQGLPLHSCVDLTSPNSSVFGLPVTTTTAENPAASGGSGGFGSGRLKPPPMAMSMPVPVPAPAQSPRVPSVSFGTMVVRGMRRAVGAGAVGDNEVNNAANADVQSPAGSTGSRQSSFLLVGGMAPEILDAGLAILRGASDNMAPPPIPADPTGTAAAPTKPALEQQSAGPVPGSNQASQTTEVEMRSLSSNTSSVKQTAAPMLPHPNPMSIVVPSVHQDAPAGSFSFTQYSRKSLEGGIQDSTLDVVSKCLPAPLSPLGASRPLPLTMEPTSGSGSLLAPATAASSTVLQRPSLEVASTAAAPLAALWGGSNGADDGAGGVNRRGIGSSVDLHNGEEEDLEVSFRVEAIAMAAQRSLKNGSVQGSAGAVVDDERLLSTLAASLPVDAVGEMMSPLAEHSDGDGHGVGVLAVRPGPLELVQFRSDLCNALSMHPPWVSTPSSHRGAEPRTMLSAALLAAANAAEAAVSDDIGRGGGETAAAASLGALTAGNGEGTDSNDADDGDSQLQAVSEAHEFADGLSAARASPPVGPAAAWILNPNSPPYQSQPQRHSYDYGQTASSVAGGPHDGSLNPPNLVLKSIGAVATASHQIAGDATVGSVGGISVSRVFSRIRSASAVEPASSASPVKDVNTEPDMITTTTETGTDVGDDRGSNAATAGAGAGAAATTISPSANQQHTSPVFNAAAAAAAISGGVVSTGGTSCGALRAQFGLGACGSGYIGVEASNAVAVVITVGYDGQLRVPLRCLELPLRAAMARRSGTTVSFRVTGLSHEGMRQLRALMAVAKVPVPERTYAWLLPSQSMHQYTGNGYTPAPGGCGPVSCTSQPLPGAGNSQILHSASAAFPSGSGLYSGLGLMYHGGGPGSPTGLMASRAISRMDSGAVYGGMPSYYFDNRGLPIDLGYILPPPTDSAEPSECLSASTHPATTVVMTGLQSLARTCSTPASAAAAVLPADGCELSPPPQAPRAPLSSWTVSVAGLVAGASPLPLPPPGSAPSSYELDPLLQQRVSPSWRSPHTSTAAEGNGTADGTGRLNGVNGGGEAVAEPNYRDGMSMSPFRASPPPMAMPTSSRSSTEDVLMQPPVAPTGEARVDGEAVDANRLNNNQSHHFKHHHGIPVQRRNPGGGSGPHNLPHGIMFVNLALQRPATPPTPLLAGSPGGASPTAGHNAIRSNNNKNSGLNAICNEGDREQYDDAAAATTSIGGAADDGVQHPLNMGTLGYRSSDLRVPSIAGVRCGGAFSGCGGLASASSSAFGCQSLGSCIADLARDSNTPLAPSLATPALIASAAGPWEHLDNRGLNDLTLGPFGSSIGVRSSS